MTLKQKTTNAPSAEVLKQMISALSAEQKQALLEALLALG